MTAPQTATEKAAPFAIFNIFLGFYLVAHHFYLFGSFGLGRAGLTILILPSAFLLMLWPRNLALFVFTIGLHFFQTLMFLPTGSNHTIMSLFLTVGLILAYLHTAVSSRQLVVDAGRYFAAFAPLGRWLLIIMYFYGTLHKINTDFLNPLSSCSVAMWHRFEFPDFIAQSAAIDSLTMYGTLMVEATALVLLLTRRFRWWGIVLGVSFHGFLGFLPPGRIVAFSLLSILLHSLFLPKDSLERFANGVVGRMLAPALASPLRRIALGLAGLLIGLMVPRDLTWGLLLIAIVGFVAVYGREPAAPTTKGPRWLVSPAVLVNLLAVAFLLNGASPYLGFKTGQTISMFSNLVTEGGRSNHLFLPNVRLFDYQDRVATILETNHPALAQWKREGYKLVEFHVLDYLARSPGTSVTFMVDGQIYAHTPEKPLASVSRLPHRWLRNLMVFRPVVLKSPRKCDSY